MLKKFGFGSIITGVIILSLGIWMIDSSGPFSYWGYGDGMRTIMEFAPWVFAILGTFGIIGGRILHNRGHKTIGEGSGKSSREKWRSSCFRVLGWF